MEEIKEELDFGDLFAAEVEPERFHLDRKDAPDTERSWVDLQPMDAAAFAKLTAAGQRIQAAGDASTANMADVAEVEKIILLNTIKAYHIKEKKKAHNGEPMEITHGSNVVPDAKRKAFLEDLIGRMLPQAKYALLAKCQQINGMDQEKNS